MRALVQRVTGARVTVEGREIGAIGSGLLIFLGVARGDGEAESVWLADKIAGLRIFGDEQGKMNRSLAELSLPALVVSQFTLLGDCRKGRRPGFDRAAEPALADRLYEHFKAQLLAKGLTVASGRFAAHMLVALVNDGPVTFLVETPAGAAP